VWSRLSSVLRGLKTRLGLLPLPSIDRVASSGNGKAIDYGLWAWMKKAIACYVCMWYVCCPVLWALRMTLAISASGPRAKRRNYQPELRRVITTSHRRWTGTVGVAELKSDRLVHSVHRRIVNVDGACHGPHFLFTPT
jgi:hypothetical protein